jgi:hypothetical protein
MATQIKPTTKNSPKVVIGKNRNNLPAESYDKRGTGSANMKADTSFAKDPNTMGANESMPGGMPARRVSVGNIVSGAKTTGIETRGNGAATKGRIARGPMA